MIEFKYHAKPGIDLTQYGKSYGFFGCDVKCCVKLATVLCKYGNSKWNLTS